MIQELMDYLLLPAHVQRVVNPLYFAMVVAITSGVLYYSIKTKNRNAIRLFVFSLFVWPAIELIGLLSGWRAYHNANVGLIFFLVGMVEDPGWVALAYIAAEKMYERWYR